MLIKIIVDSETSKIIRAHAGAGAVNLEAGEGQTLVRLAENAPFPEASKFTFDFETSALVPIPAGIGLLKADKVSALRRDCDRAITRPFQSAALGKLHHYPANQTDQLNLMAATVAGGEVMCADSAGEWALRPHTSKEAAAVLADFSATRDAARTRLDGLVKSLSAAKTPDDLAAVQWNASLAEVKARR